MTDRFKGTFLVIAVLASVFLMFGCSSNGGGTPAAVTPTTIDLSGADGGPASGPAGDGGDFYVYWYGDVTLSTATGQVDTSFAIPGSEPSYVAGDEELAVTVGMAIAATTDGATVGSGSYYMLTGVSYPYYTNLYKDDGNATAETSDAVVDSISVAEGATLTLGHNSGNRAYLRIDGDVQIAGTLTVDPLTTNPLDSGDLRIYARQVFIAPTGSVITAGGDAAAGSSVRGGHAGYITLESYREDGGFLKNEGVMDASGGNGVAGSDGGDGDSVYLWSDGVLINTGSLNSSGGDGDNGGNASYSEIDADTFLYNTGSLTAEGGEGLDGVGGYGNWVYLYAYYSALYNSGDLSANGGDGTDGGGDANGVYIYTENRGRLVSSGTLSADGGNATGDSAYGGDGGYVEIYTEGGSPISVTGTISAVGGNAGANTTFWGGDGGDLYVYSENYYSNWDNAPGDVKIDADIILTGGDGDIGGDGGYVDFDMDDNSDVLPPIGNLYIYASAFNMDGGDAPGNDGGRGGYLEVYTSDAWTGGADYPVGSVRNNVMVSAVGGAGAGTMGYYGGAGGYVELDTGGSFYVGTTVLENSGAIDVSGGAGDFGGGAGWVDLYGNDAMSNSGAITALAGAAQGHTAGYTNGVRMGSTANASNTAEIIANGGDSVEANGRYGGYVGIYSGLQSTNSGPIYADGGMGNMTTNDGTGGDGGYIELFSSTTPSSNSATLSVVAGDGLNPGENGHIIFDGANFTPASGML